MPAHDAAGEVPAAEVMDRLSASSPRTPVVKNFDPEWVATLTHRGEPQVYTKANSANFDFIGMPVGGIGAGQLYLGGDGKLWYWDIFNTKSMRNVRGVGAYARPYSRSAPDLSAYNEIEQGFAIRTEVNGKTKTLTLDRDGFADIEFRGRYPLGLVKYSDPAVPVDVELQAYSPFIPLDVDASSYPATVLEYTVSNRGKKRVTAELAGWLENASCLESRKQTSGSLRNRVVRGPQATVLLCDALEPPPPPVDATPKRPEIVFETFEGEALEGWTVEGDAFEGNPKPNFHHQPLRGHSGKGLVDSFRNGGDPNSLAGPSDHATGKLTSAPFEIARRSIRLLIGGGNHPELTCVRVVIDDKPVRSVTGADSESLRPVFLDVSAYEGKTASIEIIDAATAGWGHVLVDHIVFTDETSAPDTSLRERPDFGSLALALVDAAGDADTSVRSAVDIPAGLFETASSNDPATMSFDADASLVGALRTKLVLAPGESKTVRFVLAWYFPHYRIPALRSADGRSYGRRFRSAQHVAEDVVADLDRLGAETKLWHETWYDSTLPWWFLDRTFLNTSILATGTCYLFGEGRFYGYEGVYHGHGTCTHVWGYVQATGRLFPELERRLRIGVDFNRDIAFDSGSGRVGYRSEFNRGDAVDGQAGLVVRTYRDHQMTADYDFLDSVYFRVKRATEYLIETYDADRDGVLTGGQHNTLDARWYGKITWLSAHYGAALRAAAAMADEMAEPATAQNLRELADRGRAYIETDLFNGEYFIQEADPEHPQSPGVYNGCEYSQLLGQSWAYQVALGEILDREKVRTALRSLWKYNFSTDVGPYREQFKGGRWYAMPGEGGLIACTWPRGGSEALQKGNQHFAGYLNECQAGYEYAATSLMMWHGLAHEALAHVRTVHDRYHGSRRNPWNEVEWGSHYSRSMASYGHFTAVCGFEYHGPRGYIAFSPRITPHDFKAAFTSAEGWGSFEQERTGDAQRERITVEWGRLRLWALAFDLPAGKAARSVVVRKDGKSVGASVRCIDNRALVELRTRVTLKAGERLSVELLDTVRTASRGD